MTTVDTQLDALHGVAHRGVEPHQPGAIAKVAAKRMTAIVPALVALLTFAVFVRALSYQFVDWDDLANIAWNPRYRGLGWSHLHWMLTTIQGGHWMPLTWLTFGMDYALWGMDPGGYHLTNVLLHAANAVVFYALAARLLAYAMPGTSAAAARTGAAVAALFFALHPLRVESVAWITERRDVLSGFFWLLGVLCYLRATEHAGRKTGGWKLLSVLSYMAAVMSKSITVTLPLVLLVLDVYPLRRDVRAWRCLLLEKLSYVPTMVFGVFMALSAAYHTGYLTGLERLSVLERVAVVVYGVWFYVATTVVPFGLSPLYELPAPFHVTAMRFVGPLLLVALATATIFLARRRWPALAAAWVTYLVVLSPVSGAVHNGAQIVADRYSYLSCLPWAALLGAGVSVAVANIASGSRRIIVWRTVGVALLIVMVALPLLTLRQLSIWRDTESLWGYAVTAGPDCAMCRFQAGKVSRQTSEAGIEHFRRAGEIRPALLTWEPFLINRGLAYLAVGDVAAAENDLAAVRSRSPRIADVLGPLFITDW